MGREPDEGDGECGPAAAGGSSGSPVDEFDRIVAEWRAEGSVPVWPETADPATGPTGDAGAAGDTPPSGSGTSVAPPGAARPSGVHRPYAEDPDDDHYHPPEPPPLPRPGPPAFVGGGLIVLGLLLVAVPETLGLSSIYGLPLGLLGIAAGLTWLVMRMWPSESADERPDDGDDDDGAVL